MRLKALIYIETKVWDTEMHSHVRYIIIQAADDMTEKIQLRYSKLIVPAKAVSHCGYFFDGVITELALQS